MPFVLDQSQLNDFETNTNVHMEKAVLGAAVSGVSPDDLRLIMSLCEDDFTSPFHQAVFRAIVQLCAGKEPVDILTITAQDKDLDPSALMDMSRYGEAWHLPKYIKELRRLTQRRALWQLLMRQCRALKDGMDTAQVMDALRNSMRSLSHVDGQMVRMPDIMAALYDTTERKLQGSETIIPTGLPDLDAVIGGMYPTELTIIGARPGVGKSAFAQMIATNAARKGFKVAICSREMSDVQYAQRMVSEFADINGMKLRRAQLSNDEWRAFGDAISALSGLPISFSFRTRYVEDLIQVAQAEKDSVGLDLLVVDYVQLLQTREKTDNEVLRLGRISGKLKGLAMDLGIPVIALAQVRRTEGRCAVMPILQDLKGSGDLEQDADGVIFLHRPEVPNDPSILRAEMYQALGKIGSQLVAVNVAKQRMGDTGTINVAFDPSRMRYTCLDRRSV